MHTFTCTYTGRRGVLGSLSSVRLSGDRRLESCAVDGPDRMLLLKVRQWMSACADMNRCS